MSKFAGFLVGAGAAAVAVWGFNTWRHVSGDDFLMSALSDHCIPYVLNGDVPFDGVGRSVGIYDNVLVDDRMEQGGAKIIFESRFVASWGVINATQNLRVCRVDGRSMGATRQSLEVDADDFVARVTDAVRPLGDLMPDADRITEDDMFQTISWANENSVGYEGNRALLAVVQSRVANMLVVKDLAD